MYIKTTDWLTDQPILSQLRADVFILEQNVAPEEEWDDEDKGAIHFIAFTEQNQALGTARLLHSGQIGRMAVLKEYRDQGIGRLLLQAALDHAKEYLQLTEVYLHAQTHALGFYEQAGFSVASDEFMDAGIPHKTMRKLFSIEFDQRFKGQYEIKKEPEITSYVRARLSSGDITDKPTVLGHSSDSVLLSGEQQFEAMAIELVQQATHQVSLISTDLEPVMYEHPDFLDALSQLACRHPRGHVNLLVEDPQLIVKRGHRLLDLVRKLSSKCCIRVVHPDYPLPDSRFLMVDDCGFLFRKEADQYQGFVNFNHKQAVKRYQERFDQLWTRSQLSQELRSLNL